MMTTDDDMGDDMGDDIESTRRIEAAIPHRPPMRLVDEIVESDARHLVGRKTFRGDEFFVQGHYPGNPIVPGVILCESAMQAGAVLISEQLSDRHGVPVVTRINDVKFRRIIRPGDTVTLDVTLDEQLADAFFLTAKILHHGKVAVRFSFACTLTDATLADQ